MSEQRGDHCDSKIEEVREQEAVQPYIFWFTSHEKPRRSPPNPQDSNS